MGQKGGGELAGLPSVGAMLSRAGAAKQSCQAGCPAARRGCAQPPQPSGSQHSEQACLQRQQRSLFTSWVTWLT